MHSRVPLVFLLSLFFCVRSQIVPDARETAHQRGLAAADAGHYVCVNFKNKCNTETIFNVAIAYPYHSLEWRCRGWMNLPPQREKQVCWTSSDASHYYVHINVESDGRSPSCDLDPEGHLPAAKFAKKFAFCAHMQHAFDIFETLNEGLDLVDGLSDQAIEQNEASCEDLSDDGCYRRMSFYQVSTDEEIVLDAGC